MRVWVTRAEPGASRTAARLRELGHEPVVDPVLEVRPMEAAIDLDGVAAIAFTSTNGVEAFAARAVERALPVFTVGDATAEAALAAGFENVSSADGDAEALGRLLSGAGLPEGSTVLHPGGRDRAADLGGAVSPRLIVRSLALYETVEREPLAAATATDSLDAVLVHSPKAARRIAALATAFAPTVRWLTLSQAVAAPLIGAGFTLVTASARPNEAALLALLADAGPNPEAR